MLHWGFVVFVNSKLCSGESMKGKERRITILAILKMYILLYCGCVLSKAESKFC